MKCPFCLTENPADEYKCRACGGFLLHATKVQERYIDKLLENRVMESYDDLMQLRQIVVSCRCDDGVGLPPGLEVEIEVPLYYTEQDIIETLKQKGVCPELENRYFRIDEFHDGRLKLLNLGTTVLAEAVSDNLMKLVLHSMVFTRKAMVERTE